MSRIFGRIFPSPAGFSSPSRPAPLVRLPTPTATNFSARLARLATNLAQICKLHHRCRTPHLDEAAFAFEQLTEHVLEVAMLESKLKRLGDAIQQATRRVRVLEERVLPRLRADIRAIAAHIGEREREAHFRLKKFKERRDRRGGRA